ncbi:RidA family protein [Pseudofrankia sp. DC12]|uniref:RidA family protein n=1 Tax=Pseudofrankia sp. DC12 TaxID=683315 RepID=UPI0006989A2C|nr:RidA family protein [Pseudofrankia sp. DC12]
MSDAVARRTINPDGMAPPAARYAHAVLVENANRWLHTSGAVPVAPDGSVPDGVPAQASQVWINIGTLLAEADMTVEDIVSITTYLVATAGTPALAQAMAARDEFLGGRRVASTLVTVPALAQPSWLLEIAVVAAS